jgi:nucleotide-binding universal stress UspA family protein
MVASADPAHDHELIAVASAVASHHGGTLDAVHVVRVRVPTAGGPDSDLSAGLAMAVRAEFDGEGELLHVADDEDEGRRFLVEWAPEHSFEDATEVVETGAVETAVERRARDATLLVVGATERGLLRRVVSGWVVVDGVGDVGCSVVLAEQSRARSLRERLFGER